MDFHIYWKKSDILLNTWEWWIICLKKSIINLNEHVFCNVPLHFYINLVYHEVNW